MSSTKITINKKEFEWRIDNRSEMFLGPRKIEASIEQISRHEYSVIFKGRSYHVISNEKEAHAIIYVNNKKYLAAISRHSHSAAQFSHQPPGSKQESVFSVRAPMPGLVVRLEVKEGDRVKIGNGLLILEAMKMENEIKAMKEGIVRKIFIAHHQTVEKDQLLLDIT
jgi:glutaconyl-CoA/methylmalonyl-CoA decarboxylase subunit gamma